MFNSYGKSLLTAVASVLMLVGGSFSLHAQSQIRGTVYDTDKTQPMAGATVVVEGKNVATITDGSGKFSVNATEGDVLSVQFMGYKTQNVTVSKSSVYDIILKPDSEQLSEVIVTALGMKREKRSLGYAATEVTGEDLNNVQNSNWLSGMEGKVAGVQFTNTLLVHMPVSRYATAYCYGSSTLCNAKHHIGKRVVLKLDILHFFDSIRYSTVKDAAFPSKIYSEPLRILLAMLCYYKDVLPQGAPSSPAITNLIMFSFDEHLGQWCRERNIAYTRYCDDMTFSGDFDPAEVTDFVRLELKKLGFLLNEQKTQVQRPGWQQSVTGIAKN